MTKISILMPVYNGVHFLNDSINSILNQSFKDFELICINDSSTDNSEEVLKIFSEKDSRVKFFTKKNEGPGLALNYGVNKAEGEYLCFIDQDDKYSPLFLEKMFNAIDGTDYNMCICNAFYWDGEKPTQKIYPTYKDGNINIEKIKEKSLYKENFCPQWTKIIKKEFFIKNKIEFPGIKNKAHDLPVHLELIYLCDKFLLIDECLYYHRFHNKQLSHDIDTALYNLFSIENVFSWANKSIKNKKDFNKLKKIIKYFIENTARITKNTLILDELIVLIRRYYSGLDRQSLKYFVKRKKRKYERLEKLEQKSLLNKGFIYLQRPKILDVGCYTYCATQPIIVSKNTHIGKFCSIGENVQIGHGEHPLNFVSTSPYLYFEKLGFKTEKTKNHHEFLNYDDNPVYIGNDVWIGNDVKIKKGIKISDGAIVGMGAVVTKDVPPYAIVAGVPAKIIKYRFDEETIKQLLELKWWNLNVDEIKNIPYDNINDAIKYLKEIQ